MAKVLLLEDDMNFADLVVENLTHEGHTVEVFSTATDALNALTAESFDIIVADVFIKLGNKYSPDGGVSLISKVKQIDARNIPVIAISGSFTQSEPSAIKDTVRTVGANAVLGKPFHPEQLLNLIADLTGPGSR